MSARQAVPLDKTRPHDVGPPLPGHPNGNVSGLYANSRRNSVAPLRRSRNSIIRRRPACRPFGTSPVMTRWNQPSRMSGSWYSAAYSGPQRCPLGLIGTIAGHGIRHRRRVAHKRCRQRRGATNHHQSERAAADRRGPPRGVPGRSSSVTHAAHAPHHYIANHGVTPRTAASVTSVQHPERHKRQIS